MGRAKIVIPKEILHRLYWQEDLSPIEIAKQYKCDPITVRTRMRELGIAVRSQSSARMRYKKYDFSGDFIEKSYLIGFRLGDLNVYQTSEGSDLVVVRCNTTQAVQVELMKKLFSPYGHVTVSHGKHSININCYLNRSFMFLLSKNGTPLWLYGDDSYILAFIAGYIDAEGSFLLNQRKARFKMDAYDENILCPMAEWLQQQGINVKIRKIGLSGQERSDGTIFHHDLWRININEAQSLGHFIRMIKPYIQHQARLQQIILCETNISQRGLG